MAKKGNDFEWFDSNGKPKGNLKKVKGPGIAILIVLIVFVIAGFGGSPFYNVGEQENAVVTQFGTIVRTDTAGLYFKLPFIQQVHKVDTTTHGMQIGYVTDGAEVDYTDVDAESIMITSDFNFVDVDFYLEYRVSDPVGYLYNSKEPETILRNMTLAAIRSTVSEYTVDDVITTGKSQIQSDVKERLIADLAKNDIGLSVVNVSIQDAEPPTEAVIQAFKAVETAKQGAETAINNANKYQNEQIPAAEANADAITQAATATKEARIAEAEGQAERFNQLYDEYTKYPLITKQRMFYEAMEDILPELKVIITDGQTQELLPLDSFSSLNDSAAGTSADTSAAVEE
ncbi:MAG: FtsH protease activity modulator HflK [Lachnospiraceae bacterium]|nr:FtsH protease activity modulator HflK [Lachnospiraceae bacterium]